MRQMLSKLWNDDCGATLTGEYVFVFTLFVIGLVTGWVAVRQALTGELHEIAGALLSVDQSYSYSGQTNCQSSTAGSSAQDSADMIMNGSVAAGTKNIDENPCD